MSNIAPTTPSFVFGYWRPWNENSQYFNSYLDYSRDTSLVKYGADTVGRYINEASKEQLQAINQLGQAIGRGMNVLSNQMTDINESLSFLNRNIDIQIEQQKLSNLLLQNIAELLRVPDSEKERQHSIELGIKFFVNASKDADLYSDSLEELLKAESLMKQDYFVLHRIGCIYLYIEKYINPENALDYFLRAAKYASVESDSQAAHLAHVLTNHFNTVNSEINNSERHIGLLAADSYEKAALAAYILGRFSDAVSYQSKALKFNNNAQNKFILAKYQIRNGEVAEGIKNLDESIESDSVYALAIFKEIDLVNEPEVLNLISKKNQKIDDEISKLIDKWKAFESNKANDVVKELSEIFQDSYEIKVANFKLFAKKANDFSKNIEDTKSKIGSYIAEIKKFVFCTLDDNAIQLKIDELLKARDLPIEKMIEVFASVKKEVNCDLLKIGSKYAGGIVFYIDDSGRHGLVCAEKDFGKAFWGDVGKIEATENGISNGYGMRNSKKILEYASWYKRFFSTSKTPAPTAARLCLESNHNGFSDWYLPTLQELDLMYKTLKKNNFGTFRSVFYWSSTEDADVEAYAWAFNFDNGTFGTGGRSNVFNVRAVRAF